MEDLRTERLRLHAIDLDEAERIAAQCAGPTDAWAEDFPDKGDVLAAGEFVRRMKADGEQRPFGFYTIGRLADGLAVGGIVFKAQPKDGCVEIGYGLAPSARGAGYAAEAVARLVKLAADHGLSKVVATTTPSNFASRRTLQRAGFRHVGNDGKLDHYELRLRRREVI